MRPCSSSIITEKKKIYIYISGDFHGGLVVKNLPCNAGTWGQPLVRYLRSHMRGAIKPVPHNY